MKLAGGPVILSPLFLLEIRNALNLAIRRGEIGAPQRNTVMADIRWQIEAGFFRMASVSQAAVDAKPAGLSHKHKPRHSTRPPDLIRVATALFCEAKRFLSADARRLSGGNEAEGLKVNP